MQEYTLKTNFAALEVPQAIEYLMDFGKIIEKAFEWSCDLLVQLVSIEGGRVDYEDFEECGKLDLYWVPYVLEIIQASVCNWLTSAIIASNREFDQVYNSLSREIVMYVQKDLQTALLTAPMEYEALRKEYGQYTLIPEQYAGVLKNDQRKRKRKRKTGFTIKDYCAYQPD